MFVPLHEEAARKYDGCVDANDGQLENVGHPFDVESGLTNLIVFRRRGHAREDAGSLLPRISRVQPTA